MKYAYRYERSTTGKYHRYSVHCQGCGLDSHNAMNINIWDLSYADDIVLFREHVFEVYKATNMVNNKSVVNMDKANVLFHESALTKDLKFDNKRQIVMFEIKYL